MSLSELANNDTTDKNKLHSYLDLYQQLLVSKQYSAKNVLEIGIYMGGSIKLWHDFFINATIYGLDIVTECDKWWDIVEIKNNDRIILHTGIDAYNSDFLINNFINKNMKFDFLIDDGPHTLESMIFFIKEYSKLLTDDGILIIEDVQNISWLNILYQETPDELKPYIKMYDLRHIKDRYDDIVFVIDKSNPK